MSRLPLVPSVERIIWVGTTERSHLARKMLRACLGAARQCFGYLPEESSRSQVRVSVQTTFNELVAAGRSTKAACATAQVVTMFYRTAV